VIADEVIRRIREPCVKDALWDLARIVHLYRKEDVRGDRRSGNKVVFNDVGLKWLRFLRQGDNGPGFSKADADKLFAPFKRLPGAEKQRGYGIGLATVEKIIRRHGGKVWAEGEPDQGACFFFTLLAD